MKVLNKISQPMTTTFPLVSSAMAQASGTVETGTLSADGGVGGLKSYLGQTDAFTQAFL